MKALPATIVVLMLAGAVAFPQRSGNDEVRVSGGQWRLPPLVFTTQSNTVDLEVVVRHADGSAVAGLRQSNFAIQDNGKPEVATAFSVNAAPPPPALARGKTAAPAASAAPPPAAPAAPRFLALLFDDVTTDKADLANARNAAARFVREALGPGDRAAVLTMSEEGDFGFSPDPIRLGAAIAQVAPHPRSSKTIQNCPRITPYTAYLIAVEREPMATQAAVAEAKVCNGDPPPTGNAMDNNVTKSLGSFTSADEVVQALAEATWDQARSIAQDNLTAVRDAVTDLGRQPGKRILVLASGGFLSDTLGAQQDDIIRQAIRDNVVINALDARGLYTDGPGRPMDELPQTAGPLPLVTYFFEETSKLPRKQAEDAAAVNLAQSTGGLFFHNNNDLTLGFERLGLQPALAYELAFQPRDLVHDGKFHKIEVKLDPPIHGAIVQTRRGYFAPAPELAGASLEQSMENAMRAGAVVKDLPAELRASPRPGGVAVHLKLDAATLPFAQRQGRHGERLELLAGLFDAKGKFIAGERGEMDMSLQDATWNRFRAQGLGTSLSVAAPPGDYTLRVVVGEANAGKIASFAQPATVAGR